MSLILNGDTGISAVDGTASAPALVGNDTDTGVYFSATNTLDFATAGTRRASINSTGDLQFNSGYGSVATAYGCRAWVNFDGTTNTGGFCTIRGSGNVSSITDHGTGDYSANFTTALPDFNYCVQYSIGALDANFWGPIPYIYSQATTSCRVRSVFASGSFTDAGTSNISIFR